MSFRIFITLLVTILFVDYAVAQDVASFPLGNSSDASLCDFDSLGIDFRSVSNDTPARANKALVEHASSSVLSTGKWAKVRVKTSGMKMLSNAALKQMGFTDPSKVSVYGNGGEQLPFDNNKLRPDDLVRQPVVRTPDGILFYAEGVVTWTYNQTYSRFLGNANTMSEYSYYFLTDAGQPSDEPARHVAQSSVSMSTSIGNSRGYFEENVSNLLNSGREWYGPRITSAKGPVDIDIPMPSRTSPSQNLKITMRLIGRSGSELPYTLSLNGEDVVSGTVAKSNLSGSGVSDYAKAVTRNLSVKSADTDNVKLRLSVDFNTSTDCVWLDYISVTSEASLDMANASQYSFRYLNTFTRSGATEYRLKHVKKGTRVWNVADLTNIEEVDVTVAGDSLLMVHDNGSRTEFVAFDPSASFEAPEYVGPVANQNLHGIDNAQYIIVTHADFLEQANRLAEIHRNNQGLNVVVAECEQIYNEFSSGKRDVSAIRDFIKMVYDRDGSWETGLRYVLLFGDGSFDNLTVGSSNEGNKIPTYQSANSIHEAQTYVTDDFFGWMDDSEGSSDTGARMDIGVGRFPCRTLAEATALVDKSEIYLTSLDPGAWKTQVSVVADDGDKNEHLMNAEALAQIIENMQPGLTVNRIFLESYAATTTSTGVVYAGAHNDFTNAVNNGSLFLDYVGHGGSTALTDDGLFKQKDIVNWTNKHRLPMFVTAACDFGPFDVAKTSSGEESLMYAGGGFIGVFTTTRVVYSDSNFKINKSLLGRLLATDENGDYYSMGEASRFSKVETGGLINSLKYVLLGDPALSLFRNHQSVVTDSVNGVSCTDSYEPLNALGLSRISGSVRDEDGEVDDSFNGHVNVTLFDKKSVSKTTGIKSDIYKYEEYKTVLFSGVADVRNGRFSLEFTLSKDINFMMGNGRMVYYAVSDDNREADGSDFDVTVGGVSQGVAVDTVGPVINAWLDFSEFQRDGYTTGPSPTLFAVIDDPSGINTSGLGVGHDLTLYVNGDRKNSISLNGYFTYDAGSHSRGLLVYKLSDLPEGDVSISLKAWDNMNNSTLEMLNVNVKKDCPIGFGSVKVFPNPFRSTSDNLYLQFSHNDGGMIMSADVSVYSVGGLLITKKTISVVASLMQVESVSLSAEMPELLALPKGLYVLKAEFKDNNGRKGSFIKRFSVAAK